MEVSSLRTDIQLDRPARPSTPLIRDNEMSSAQGELSRRRLQDTVLNEFPSVQQYADRLKGGSALYSSASEPSSRLALEGGDASAAIDQLTLSGLLRVSNGQFVCRGFIAPRSAPRCPDAAELLQS